MKISHIVTNGCSFTYCQNLPIEQGWPSLLANELNCPVVNLGLPGVGNDNIHRRTYEYIYNNLSYNNIPLVIIGWSQPWRREAWLQYEVYRYCPGEEYYSLSYPHDKVNNAYEQGLLDHWNDEDHYRRTLIHKVSLMNLLENLKIPYIMTDFMVQRDNEDISKRVDSMFPGLAEKIYSNKFYINPMYEITRFCPKLPCGHDGVEAQSITKNYLIQSIKELYPNLIFTKNENFYSLKDFSQMSKLHLKFPDWCDFKLDSDKIS